MIENGFDFKVSRIVRYSRFNLVTLFNLCELKDFRGVSFSSSNEFSIPLFLACSLHTHVHRVANR